LLRFSFINPFQKAFYDFGTEIEYLITATLNFSRQDFRSSQEKFI